jgi:NhaP-type Na+/H+ or K+/H+ antiporter
VRKHWRDVTLLLAIAMPAMALISTGLALSILEASFAGALLIGVAVCPTDPALPSSVVNGKDAEDVHVRARPRAAVFGVRRE